MNKNISLLEWVVEEKKYTYRKANAKGLISITVHGAKRQKKKRGGGLAWLGLVCKAQYEDLGPTRKRHPCVYFIDMATGQSI